MARSVGNNSLTMERTGEQISQVADDWCEVSHLRTLIVVEHVPQSRASPTGSTEED